MSYCNSNTCNTYIDDIDEYDKDGKICYEHITIYPLMTTNDKGVVIRIDDVTKQFSNTEFLQYTIWKNKSIIAGYNPSLSQNEIEAINMLSMIRDQANEYLMNNQLNNPAFRQYGNFPINPFTSSNRIARTGKATVQDGWSYDENCGIFRIVLPNGHACRGISQENIETPHLQPSSYEK